MRDRDMWVGEYHVLLLFAVLGMLIMVSANGFLTLYLGLELLSLCLYALVAFDRDSKAGAEAAMKYFVLGALGSGMLLYGISMLYGASGGFAFADVAAAVASDTVNDKILVFGLVFALIGIAFKFGAVPFHMWMPDVYQGAPTPIVLFLSSAPKIAAFAMAARILIEAMGGLQTDWGEILVILSVLSLALGNVVAIAQKNIKRMLAYSTISHVGFIFLGLLAGTDQGYASAMFYSVVYALMSAGAFGVLLLISSKGHDVQELDDLKGLSDRDPWLGAMMALIMFSMAGVPPMVGFVAKLLVLEAIIAQGMVWLAIVAVIFSIIGAFYYLRVVKMIYFDKPTTEVPVVTNASARVAITVNGAAILLLGMYPAALFSLCQQAFAV
jgi:NADH-quinone oxidoreductase subunit N